MTADIRKTLSDRELGSKLTYLENVRPLNEARYELVVQRRRYEEATAAIATAAEARAQAVAEYRCIRAGELAEAERTAIGLRAAAHSGSLSQARGRGRCEMTVRIEDKELQKTIKEGQSRILPTEHAIQIYLQMS